MKSLSVRLFLLFAIALSGCGEGKTSFVAEIPSGRGSTSQPPASAPRQYEKAALLFVGSGTWTPEVASLRQILDSHGVSYDEADSDAMDAMSLDELSTYGVLIFPGGSGGTEANSLSAATHAKLRVAVQERGVSYVGFCAGAYIAVAPAPSEGEDVSYGLGIVDGPLLDDYYLAARGVDYQMTLLSFPGGTTKDILWYGGPITPNQGVVARYPDGTPAISEMWSGAGFVVISGPHPTASASILSGLGLSSSDGTHTDYAWELISAAIQRQPLPTF